MKWLFWVILFFSCVESKDYEFCYVRYSDNIDAHSVSKNYLENRIHNVYFIGGTNQEHERTKTSFKAIDDICGLGFKYVTDINDSDIRVTFNKQGGAWSYIGRDIYNIPKNKPTMNIGFEYETAHVGKHEFSHTAGRLHEHQHPLEPVNFDKAFVNKIMSGPPNYWIQSMINYNIYDLPLITTVDVTPRDDESIMLYGFPCTWVTDGKGCNRWNTSLSSGDSVWYLKHYPNIIDTISPTICPLIDYIKNISANNGIYRFNTSQLRITCDAMDIPYMRSDNAYYLRQSIIKKLN